MRLWRAAGARPRLKRSCRSSSTRYFRTNRRSITSSFRDSALLTLSHPLGPLGIYLPSSNFAVVKGSPEMRKPRSAESHSCAPPSSSSACFSYPHLVCDHCKERNDRRIKREFNPNRGHRHSVFLIVPTRKTGHGDGKRKSDDQRLKTAPRVEHRRRQKMLLRIQGQSDAETRDQYRDYKNGLG